MKVVGVVTEYNPFHNGHKYHIEEAKRVTGAEYVVAVMSGNFVQRGAPAVIDKYSRTEMALRNGVDLVLELPVCYATGSAEYFAHGAVSLLDQLGIVDTICFGSECGDIRPLEEASEFLINTPESFDTRLQSYLKEGMTYPAARQKALLQTVKDSKIADGREISKVLTEPNNILGIEYMKAIKRLNSRMEPVTIQRISAHYHDNNLVTESVFHETEDHNYVLKASLPQLDIPEADNLTISSATAIRKAIHQNGESSDYFDDIRHSVPDDVYDLLSENYQRTFPMSEDDFAPMIKYKLLTQDKETLASYMDVSSDLADRLKNSSDYHIGYKDLVQAIKTKNTTLTRISRALTHILLNLRSDDIEEYNRNGYVRYARVLGVKKDASHLLRKIEKNGRIPIITKVSKAEEQLDSLALRMLQEDILATHIYNQTVFDKFKTSIPNEYKHGICLE